MIWKQERLEFWSRKKRKKGRLLPGKIGSLDAWFPAFRSIRREEGSDMEEDFTTRIFRKWKDAIRLDLRLRCRWQIRFLLRHMTFGWNM